MAENIDIFGKLTGNESLSDLKKKRTHLHLAQIALGDYQKPQEVKSSISTSLKTQLEKVNQRIAG